MKGGSDGTFKGESTKAGMIQQFKCTSSLIFLTHREVVRLFKSRHIADIEKIYDESKTLLWTSGDEQNVTDMPMKTLHVCLKGTELFSKIMTLSRMDLYSSSFYNVVAIEKSSSDFIQDNLEVLNEKAAVGDSGEVDSEIISNKPPELPYVKHTNAYVGDTSKRVKVHKTGTGLIKATVVAD